MHVLGLDVDVLQHVAVAGDLLLGPVPRPGPVRHDIRDAIVRRHHPFDAVGRLGALYLGGMLQRLEDLGSLLGVKLLAALVFAQLADGLEEPLGKGLPLDEAIEKGSHEALI